MLRLRNVITSRNMTVKDCAAFLGFTEKTLSNKLSGATEFTYAEARKLKALFPEYDIDYLLSPIIDEKGA